MSAAPRTIAMVSNPTAGNHSPARLDRLCRSFAARDYTVRHYDSRSFSADEIDANVDLICVSGGDGTLRTAIENNRAMPHETPYCVFPAGTINLVAREAGYRASTQRFVPDVIGRCGGRRHVLGRINEQVFLCCASIGPDSHAVAQVSPRLKKAIGRLAYPAAMLRLLVSWPRNKLDVRIDGASHSAEGIFILKGRYYAGPWVLDQQASLTSDRFRVLLMPRARRRDFARFALSMVCPMLADPHWQRLDASTVEIAGPDAVPVQADGDLVATTPVRITVDPNPLNFM